MAFSSKTLSISLAFGFSLLLLCFPQTSSLPLESGKVSLSLYYESLCPYSANFVVNYLVKLFEDDLISIVDLKLVPWGNAKLRANDTLVCQHGPSECLLNTVEACAINAWPALNDHFPFIYCIESLAYAGKYPQWESCYEKLGLNSTTISECYNNGTGKELELQYAAETDALQPPHQYVPWVVVDGQPLYEDYENFLSYICNAYNGTAIFKACNEVFLSSIHMRKEKFSNPVECYEQTVPALFGWIRSTLTSWMDQVNMGYWI